MNIQKATTKLEGYVIISGIGLGYSVGHAVAIVAPMMGIGIGLSAAAAFFIFWRFFEKNCAGMELPVLINLRGLGGGLLGLMAGGTIKFKMPMVDDGLTVFALVVSLFFFWLIKNGSEA